MSLNIANLRLQPHLLEDNELKWGVATANNISFMSYQAIQGTNIWKCLLNVVRDELREDCWTE